MMHGAHNVELSTVVKPIVYCGLYLDIVTARSSLFVSSYRI
jgi:hypothetical protein